ncbi:hypothetical protein ACEWY4_004696 [Coilia grayii]|uniref:Threonine synthase-like 2 n=1 Tax=Coilia grayii TaxID=363190 RepID=A0ABD1KMD9_9TELE
MRYCSTRGEVRGWDFRQVLFSGYAPDGGMFMPETVPSLAPETLRSLKRSGLISGALSKFVVPGVVSIAKLKDGLSILELFHGETLAFKDLAMTCTVRFLEYFLRKDGSRATILVGTSGDTGGSAICSARGLAGVDVVVVFPRGRITPVQERQMTTNLEDNVHVFAADGTSDDIDVPLRRLFADQDLVKRHGLMSLNSVNMARILVQLAHFLFAYLRLSGVDKTRAGEPLPALDMVVPTGGAGNIAAGCIVKHMGVPLRFVAMVNSNDIVCRAVQKGDFSMAPIVTQTLAPAIDIQDPYNMERVLWLLSGKNGPLVKQMLEEFQKSHRLPLPDTLHKELSSLMSAGSVCDKGIVESMRRCWEENHYLVCPHTAVAVWYHYQTPPRPGENRCYVATASPAKFQAAVQEAGLSQELPEAVRALESKATRYTDLELGEDWEARLRERIEAIGSARARGSPFYST